jgi:hypothetical protein
MTGMRGRWGYPVTGVIALLATSVGWTAGASALSPSGSAGTASGQVAVEAAPRAPEGAMALGATSQQTAMSGEVVLQPRDNAALVSFINEVTDKASPSFGHYLAPGAFEAAFGPRPGVISAVRSQLRADGITVTGVSTDGLFVSFRGSAGAVERAFHTGIERYRLADGSVGEEATSAISVPRSIAGSVVSVIGLNDLVDPQPVGATRNSHASTTTTKESSGAGFSHPAGSATACADAKATASAYNGLTDDQIAHAYGASGLYGAGDLGAGQHVAIYEAEPFLISDVKAFDTCYFGATEAAAMLKRLRVIPVDGGQPAGSGSGESIMDVEDVSALAPGANIDVYESPNPGTNADDYDPIDPYVAIVDADQDQEASTSWGLCEQAIQQGQPGLQQAENLLFEQAAAQGQSFFSAAGDNGSDDCNTNETSTPISGQNPVSVDDPGSQPYVVSVGGTTIDAATQPPTEQIWNDGPSGGAGGGGISESWAMPTWQRESTVPGVAIPGDSDYRNADAVEKQFGYAANFCQSTVSGADSTTPCRVVPDVSAQADWNIGAITVYQALYGGWYTDGGTSSSTPLWAAIVALSNASPTCASNPSTRRGVGFVSPLLYSVASSPAQYAASFNDIKLGNNDVYGLESNGVFPATSGYDLASGLGSPQLTGPGGTAGLAYYLCSAAVAPSRPVVSGITPTTGPIGGGTRITISGGGFENGGKSNVATIEIGAAQLPPTDFSVKSSTQISAVLPPVREARPPVPPAPQDGAGPANVVVTLKDDESSAAGPRSVFQYVDTRGTSTVPSVTGVVPSGGFESAPANVTILGSGFSSATKVSFGGVPATKFTVLSPNELSVTPPAYSSKSRCAPLPKTGVYAGENASNDICQVQVIVSNIHGVSATGRILAPYEGAVSIDNLGALVAPPGCDCETAAVPTEYDYVPRPRITSVSTSNGPSSLASEKGGTLLTVRGSGFDPLTIDWVNFGSPSLWSSQITTYAFASGDVLQIPALAESRTTGPLRVPLSVTSLGGQSPEVRATYAGVPRVTGVANTVDQRRLDGISGAADTGQTPIRISGTGFSGQLEGPIEFTGAATYASGTQYSYTVESNGGISTDTVAQIPGLVDVQVCTVTGCSPEKTDKLYLYAPGDPSVTSVQPNKGPAAGGTKVTIVGDNLSCPLYVYFGHSKVKAATSMSASAGFVCGSVQTFKATSPPGAAHTTVPVIVETVESYFANVGSGRAGKFTYT